MATSAPGSVFPISCIAVLIIDSKLIVLLIFVEISPMVRSLAARFCASCSKRAFSIASAVLSAVAWAMAISSSSQVLSRRVKLME